MTNIRLSQPTRHAVRAGMAREATSPEVNSPRANSQILPRTCGVLQAAVIGNQLFCRPLGRVPGTPSYRALDHTCAASTAGVPGLRIERARRRRERWEPARPPGRCRHAAAVTQAFHIGTTMSLLTW